MEIEMKYNAILDQTRHVGGLSASVPVTVALRKGPEGVTLYAKNDHGLARITIPSVSFRRMLREAGL